MYESSIGFRGSKYEIVGERQTFIYMVNCAADGYAAYQSRECSRIRGLAVLVGVYYCVFLSVWDRNLCIAAKGKWNHACGVFGK